MSENRCHKKRRRLPQNDRQMLQKKRRRKKRMLLFLMLCAIFLILLVLAYKNSSVSEDPAAVSSTFSPESSDTADSSDSTAAVTLTESQLHTGDLILVNSDHPYDFDANADSIDLVRIRSAQSFDYPVDKEEFQLASRVMPHLDAMIRGCDEACGTSSGEVSVSSAYRSEDYQKQVLQEITDEYGEDYASAFVAAPRYSEHHTGLAVDLGITLSDGSAGSFTGSDQAAWMSKHCSEYGFVRRYPEDKADITGISNESWHFRYVGLPQAKYMADHNLVLEEYLEYLRSSTSEASPLEIAADDGTDWSVWYTEEKSPEVSAGTYTVSGDNIGGYIISAVRS